MPNALSPEFWDNEDKLMWEALSADYARMLRNGALGGVAALPASAQAFVSWDLINQWAMEYARQYRFEWIRGINRSTRDYISTAITDWIESGARLQSLEDVLKLKFNDARAEMIASTETTRLYAKGNKLAWDSTGVIEEFRWMTAVDERVCEICGPNHNQTFPLSQMDELIPAHPRCRCWGQPVVSTELARQRLNEIL